MTVKFKKKLTSNLTNLNNFHSLEAVDRVSETQLQVGENLHTEMFYGDIFTRLRP